MSTTRVTEKGIVVQQEMLLRRGMTRGTLLWKEKRNILDEITMVIWVPLESFPWGKLREGLRDALESARNTGSQFGRTIFYF